jgi:hypothetical protein
MAAYKFKSLLYLLSFILCAWLYYQTGTAEMLPGKNTVAQASAANKSTTPSFINL